MSTARHLRAAWLFLLAASLFAAFTPSAHAIRSTAFDKPTSPPENRVGGFDADSSGRFLLVAPEKPDGTMVLVGCVYETASGLREWLNRDPFGEEGFESIRSVDFPVRMWRVFRPVELLETASLYEFVSNSPINRHDYLGLKKCPNLCIDHPEMMGWCHVACNLACSPCAAIRIFRLQFACWTACGSACMKGCCGGFLL